MGRESTVRVPYRIGWRGDAYRRRSCSPMWSSMATSHRMWRMPWWASRATRRRRLHRRLHRRRRTGDVAAASHTPGARPPASSWPVGPAGVCPPASCRSCSTSRAWTRGSQRRRRVGSRVRVQRRLAEQYRRGSGAFLAGDAVLLLVAALLAVVAGTPSLPGMGDLRRRGAQCGVRLRAGTPAGPGRRGALGRYLPLHARVRRDGEVRSVPVCRRRAR